MSNPDIIRFAITILLCAIAAVIAIYLLRMSLKEYRDEQERIEKNQYRAWKQQDNLRWYAEQRTEDTRADLIRAWKELDV